VRLSISSDSLSEDEVQQMTRDLCSTLNRETDAKIRLDEQVGDASTKGDLVAIGNLVISLLTSDMVGSLFRVLKSYFERSPSLVVEIKSGDGKKKIRIEAHDISSKEIDKTLVAARAILGGSS